MLVDYLPHKLGIQSTENTEELSLFVDLRASFRQSFPETSLLFTLIPSYNVLVWLGPVLNDPSIFNIAS